MNRELFFNEYRVSAGEEENILEMDAGVDCVTTCMLQAREEYT